MKYTAKIYITLREGILDVQGKQVEHGLHSIEFDKLTNVRIGRYVTLDVESDSSDSAKDMVENACKKLIANPIVEDYSIEIVEA